MALSSTYDFAFLLMITVLEVIIHWFPQTKHNRIQEPIELIHKKETICWIYEQIDVWLASYITIRPLLGILFLWDGNLHPCWFLPHPHVHLLSLPPRSVLLFPRDLQPPLLFLHWERAHVRQHVLILSPAPAFQVRSRNPFPPSLPSFILCRHEGEAANQPRRRRHRLHQMKVKNRGKH